MSLRLLFLISYYIPYKWNLKINDTNELKFTKEKETHRLEKGVTLPLGKGQGEGIVREFGMDRYTLLHLKQITNKDQLYST